MGSLNARCAPGDAIVSHTRQLLERQGGYLRNRGDKIEAGYILEVGIVDEEIL